MRPEPYWQVIERGLSLGYRKSREGGAWVVRRYDASQRRYVERRIGTASDHRDPDGLEVLDHAQAQRAVLKQAHEKAEEASGKRYAVKDAVADYLEFLRSHRKSAADAEIKFRAYVLPQLGDRRVSELRPADFQTWLGWALKRQARRRARGVGTAAKAPRKASAASKRSQVTRQLEAEELLRRRKATVNRVIAMLKACLNHAFSHQRVSSRDSWSRLKKFRAVDSARLRWLTVEEAKRLLNASRSDFRALVQAGLLTGCREAELLAARARDFDPKSETLLIADSKSGKSRRVPLTKEGTQLFEGLSAPRSSDEPLFTRSDGTPWHRVAVIRAMQEACRAGRIDPPATFYTLRHTYASHLVQAGAPLLFVASALGHRDARMVEKHYGHFAPSHVAEVIRSKLPDFGIAGGSKVRRLRPR